MSVKTSKVEPVKWQASLRRCKSTKEDVKSSLVSPSSSIKESRSPFVSQRVSPSSSIKESRSPFLSQRTLRRVASSVNEIKSAHREVAKISSSSFDSSKWTGNFILTVELRRKIIAFRGIIDLPPLTSYLSITNMVIRTMKDLHKLCPEIVDSSQILAIRRADVDKLLDQFYNALKSIGDSWIDDNGWIIRSKYRNTSVRKNLSDQIVEKVLVALDGLIKGMNERLNVTEIRNDVTKNEVSPQGKTSSKRPEPVKKQPITPRSVLTPPRKVGDFAISVSNLPKNVRMHALVKLSPMDVKRLATENMFQKEAQSKTADVDNESVKEKQEKKSEKDSEKVVKPKEAILEEKVSVKNEIDGNAALPPPQPLPMAARKGPAPLPPPPPGAAALQPPPLLPMAAGKGPASLPLPPSGAAPPPPPPMAAGKGPGALPPPPGAAGKGPGGPPPPPPLRLGIKKATSKLKRSTQLGELYRFVKEIIEGKNPEAKSRAPSGGSKVAIGSAPAASGKQGMADALAEITKNSPYFQRIQADVQMYMKAINELKREISMFRNKDITELLTFHQYMESVLEKLADETQVLSRCEGFPQSKLEAIRLAAALYSKLQGMIKELKNWKIVSPANQLFEKTERYFAKIRKEIEKLDQTKAEEEKTFKSHNIHFDFNILIQIKELMVDISSGCMELALKEKREAKIASHAAESRVGKASMKDKTVGWAKTLWRAFQFAHKVYHFAGGHDDRADKLTKELADEINLILGNHSS
ncbi:hypothetical protein AALP_AA1G121000 [Arabis alpina]|uniref:Hydroxyproline-rich glycoprotein family protein n=1 Tax=Arabis alpina TaxID=50452 RepID=A0A087HMP7_ARAAL|nr:hypothetical protein AALP_AA1G121000 [Arabis alpina]